MYPPQNDTGMQDPQFPTQGMQDTATPEMQDTLSPSSQDLQDPNSTSQNNQSGQIPEEVDPKDLVTELTEEDKKYLTDVILQCKREDQDVRNRQLYLWRKLENYWNNILTIFWDSAANDWCVPDWNTLEDSLPPRLINIYRPHGEAIVAALTIRTPDVMFFPDDAEEPDDITTAKVYSDIVDLISKHNEADMLFIKLICLIFNQGTVFAYSYHHKDKSYGVLQVPTYEQKQANYTLSHCQQCGAPLDMNAGTAMHAPQQPVQCPECGFTGTPDVSEHSEPFDQLTGYSDEPKGRVCLNLYGGTNVKVPIYARSQKEFGYLLLEFEQSTSLLRSQFPEIASTIKSHISETYDDITRTATVYLGQTPENVTSVLCAWLRPWQLWTKVDDKSKETIAKLIKAYPDGLYVILINNLVAEVYNEDLDKHWTTLENPMSTYIYAPPLGENLANVQDIRGELVELEIETIEHGISERFADPAVLDFEQYKSSIARPGMITQVKPLGGKSISESFYESKTATLSQEVDPVRQHIDTDAQFVSAAVPSIYGGPSVSGSKTAAEYRESRAAALQRLGTTWKVCCSFWAKLMSKATTEYVENIQEDEKFVKKNGTSFVNVWIQQAKLQGKVGNCEPEVSDQLPVGWELLKDTIINMFQMKDPNINAVLMHPRNMEVVKKAVGVNDLYIPGEDDRNKQEAEFIQLSQGMPNPDGSPSIPTDPDIDDAEVHMQVLKSILVGDRGRWLRESNPGGYENCVAHYKMHEQDVVMNTTKQSGGAAPGMPPESAAPPVGH